MNAQYSAAQVRIVEFAATRVGAYEYRGDVRAIDEAVERFIAWRKDNHLPLRVFDLMGPTNLRRSLG